MKICPKDRSFYLENHNYCRKCGSKLVIEKEPKCSNCGKILFGKYCVYCGKKNKSEKLIPK